MPSVDEGVILPCTVVVGIQAMSGVKLLTVVFVVLLVMVMSGTVLCTVRECQLYNKRNNKGNSIHIEEIKPAAPINGVTGFYAFIMLLWSRNHGKSSGQSLEPVGSEIFLAHRAYDSQKDF